MKKKNGKMKKILGIILTASLLLAAIPVYAEPAGGTEGAVPSKETEETIRFQPGYIPEFFEKDVAGVDPDLTLEEAMEGLVDDEGASSLQYDGSAVMEPLSAAYPSAGYADTGALLTWLTTNLPATRNQNPWGTCWAVSSITLTELYALKHSIPVPSGGAITTDVDFSELHLLWYAYHDAVDHFQAADPGGSVDGSYFLTYGGNFMRAWEALFKYRGAADETVAPYSLLDKTVPAADQHAYEQSYDLPGHDGNAAEDQVHIRNAYYISIGKNPELVKEAIRENGGVGVIYYNDTENNGYYSAAHNSYYCDTKKDANHSVVLVGWNDSFPKEYFNTQASKDGAWLVRNSWTKTAALSQGAYFWLSYDDKGLEDAAYVFEADTADDEIDHNYYYDGLWLDIGSYSYDEFEKNTYANVYKASGNRQQIRDVVLQTYSLKAEAPYNVKVYTDLSDPEDPESGILSAEKSGTIPFSGRYTIPLSSYPVVESGKLFSIVVEVGNYQSLSTEIEWLDPGYPGHVGMERGQSFSLDPLTGKWSDLYDDLYNAEPVSQEYRMGNYVISALTTDIAMAKPSAVFTAAGEAEGVLTNLVDGGKYTWKLNDGVPAEFTASGTEQTLTGLGAGKLSLVRKSTDPSLEDSNPQEITITKPDAPSNLGKTDCTKDAQDGSITGTTSAMEYRLKGAEQWTAIVGEAVTGLAAGTYEVRFRADGTALASKAAEVTIEVSAEKTKEDTPAAVFTATDESAGTLTNLTDGATYALTGASPKSFTAKGTEAAIRGLGEGTISIVRKASDPATRADSDPQLIQITQQKTPEGLTKTDCTGRNKTDGTIVGVTFSMHYRMDGQDTWTDITDKNTSYDKKTKIYTLKGLAPGVYYVRTKPSGTALASPEVSFIIEGWKNELFVEGLEASYPYTGKQIKPDPYVYYGTTASDPLVLGKDYSVTYGTNIEVGENKGSITVNLKGSYSGTKTVYFTIAPVDINEVTANDISALTTGASQKDTLKPVVTFSGKTLKEGVDYTLSYPDEDKEGAYTSAGTWEIQITGTGTCFSAAAMKTPVYMILRDKGDLIPLSKVKVTLDDKDDIEPFNPGSPTAQTPSYTLSIKETDGEWMDLRRATKQKKNGVWVYTKGDYTETYTNNIYPGTATVTFTATGTGNYYGTKKVTFRIVNKKYKLNDSSDPENPYTENTYISVTTDTVVPYTKGGAKPEVIVTDTRYSPARTLVKGKDYTVSYSNNSQYTYDYEKPAKVSITGKGSYTGKVVKEFFVIQASLSDTKMLADDVAESTASDFYKKTKITLIDTNGKNLAGTDYAVTEFSESAPAVGSTVRVTVNAREKIKKDKEGDEYNSAVYYGSTYADYRIITADQKKAFQKVKATFQSSESLPYEKGFEYTGSPIEPTGANMVLKDESSTELVENTDYRIEAYQNNTNTGTAKIVVRGIGDRFGGLKTLTFKIIKRAF